jgi:hypothetical protein
MGCFKKKWLQQVKKMSKLNSLLKTFWDSFCSVFSFLCRVLSIIVRLFVVFIQLQKVLISNLFSLFTVALHLMFSSMRMLYMDWHQTLTMSMYLLVLVMMAEYWFLTSGNLPVNNVESGVKHHNPNHPIQIKTLYSQVHTYLPVLGGSLMSKTSILPSSQALAKVPGENHRPATSHWFVFIG